MATNSLYSKVKIYIEFILNKIKIDTKKEVIF